MPYYQHVPARRTPPAGSERPSGLRGLARRPAYLTLLTTFVMLGITRPAGRLAGPVLGFLYITNVVSNIQESAPRGNVYCVYYVYYVYY